MEYNHRYASRGQGNAGVVGAALGGTALLAAMSGNGCGGGCNNGILGNLFGGNNNNCHVTQVEQAYAIDAAVARSEQYATLQAKNDLEKLYAELRTQDARIADGLIQVGNGVSRLDANVACLQREVDRNREEGFRNLAEAKSYTDTRVTAEADLRKCEDEKVVLWAKGELATKVTASPRVALSQLCGPVSGISDCDCA